MSSTKYGLLAYETENIGDEVQSIAAKRFIPKVDYYFDRDNIDGTNTGAAKKIKLIMNGWYTHKPENWPPKNPAIEPLLVAMHVEQDALEGRAAAAFVSEASRQFLAKHGPVGARNFPTLELLKKNGVDAYFSGCVTLTLIPDPKVHRQDFVLAVDVSDAVYEKIKSRTRRPIVRLDTYRSPKLSREDKFLLAKYWLFLYQSAHAVVTTRLHTMLPCLAFKTPVFAISGRDPKRYKGLIDLVRHSDEKEFLQSKKIFDLDNPGSNPSEYLAIRKDLEERCSAFTNYDSGRSYLEGQSINELTSSVEFMQLLCRLVGISYDYYVLSDVTLPLKDQEILRLGATAAPLGIKGSAKSLAKALLRKLGGKL